MEISINNIITGLQSIKAFLDYSMFKGLEEQTKVQWFVLEDAIKVMHKYQEIENIVRNYYNEQYTDKLDIEIIEMISEVLCDGNVD